MSVPTILRNKGSDRVTNASYSGTALTYGTGQRDRAGKRDTRQQQLKNTTTQPILNQIGPNKMISIEKE